MIFELKENKKNLPDLRSRVSGNCHISSSSSLRGAVSAYRMETMSPRQSTSCEGNNNCVQRFHSPLLSEAWLLVHSSEQKHPFADMPWCYIEPYQLLNEQYSVSSLVVLNWIFKYSAKDMDVNRQTHFQAQRVISFFISACLSGSDSQANNFSKYINKLT